MGDTNLFQKLPNPSALLSGRGGDSQQGAAANRILAGLDTTAVARPLPDLARNHRLARGTLSYGDHGVYGGGVRGLDAFELQNSRQSVGHQQQQLAGTHRYGPRRLVSSSNGK